MELLGVAFEGAGGGGGDSRRGRQSPSPQRGERPPPELARRPGQSPRGAPRPKQRQLTDEDKVLLQQVRCTRVACGCAIFLCLLWPSLLAAGIVLMNTANPREEQLASLGTLSAGYSDARTAMQRTTATTASGVPLDIEFDDSAVVGTSERSQFFQSLRRVPIPENNGPNLGTVSVTLTYQGRPFVVQSPPVELTRPASKNIECTIGSSSVCGTRSCCTPSAMQSKCLTVRHPSSSSAINFVATEATCFLGETCGKCEYNQFISSVCFVLVWDSALGWVRDTTKNSCLFPFDLEGQLYADPNEGANIFLRLSNDPFIIMQELTSGTMTLAETKTMERSGGRGMLLCGILVLVMLMALIGVVHCCHFNVCDFLELRVMLGLNLSEKQVKRRQAAIAAKRDPERKLGAPVTAEATTSYLAQPLTGGNRQYEEEMMFVEDGPQSPATASRRLNFSSNYSDSHRQVASQSSPAFHQNGGANASGGFHGGGSYRDGNHDSLPPPPPQRQRSALHHPTEMYSGYGEPLPAYRDSSGIFNPNFSGGYGPPQPPSIPPPRGSQRLMYDDPSL